ncbi:MAG: hypothetical protein A3A43_03080 [Candidatus Liptonbacteria bacterium RIFCSPLOWO2_01_FULL_56_20]|uniref:Uncharacterized protein n=1 Tax=Candidatus Liptonbacteria bacterium RIFCSPLOWO2_01_FULL_56_20 TaxID=1798652 RepID=A0A1G2CII2_9BACT|nr:MAG: hypothetical protein A3A43_03080 [Candidatus Liptonbacteria bacterium RIFCSPLOWO2_01_FULL_56_20]
MTETRNCQNCKQPFVIEPDDFAFYEKIKVPPPSWCPECRMVRRMDWRNERTLYKRGCNAPGHNEEVISVFSPDKPFTVYDQKYWWSDQWDTLATGKNYDFSKPFFSQLKGLFESTPLLTVFNGNAVNSDYANHTRDSKNSYLISAGIQNENVLYANRTAQNKDSVDLYLTDKMEGCYEDVNCGTSYRLFFSFGCEDCRDSWFLYDCRNCSNCFGCVGLRNKSYYIFNQPHTKEGYKEALRGFDLGSHRSIEDIRKRHRDLVRMFPKKFMYSFKVVGVVGDIVGETKNCRYCFDLLRAEDSKFIVWGGFNLKDAFDGYGMGGNAELLYEVVDVGLQGSNAKFSVVAWGCHDVQYSYNCHGSFNLFACVGLRNKQYCILNKQYTKEEYEKLVPKIIEHMNTMPYVDKQGRVYKYGEFFPPELSPFAYNETIAQEYFPLTKEQALAKGYCWKDPETKQYTITKKPEDLPDHIKDVDDSILKETIGCAHAVSSPSAGSGQIGKPICNHQCTTAFKLIPQELQFYRRMNLPLPRLCPNCRHYERLKQRNPLKLWHRKCTCAGAKSENGVYQNTIAHFHKSDPCPNKFETSYAPNRPEVVYCEQCYNAEVV